MSISLKEKKEVSERDSIGKITAFFLFRNLIDNYNENKLLDSDKKKTIKKYGVFSLMLSIISILVSVSCLITTLINVEFQGASVILIMIVSIFGCVVIPFILSLYAFVFAVLQVRLNHNSIGILSLVLAVLSCVSCILLIIFLIV